MDESTQSRTRGAEPDPEIVRLLQVVVANVDGRANEIEALRADYARNNRQISYEELVENGRRIFPGDDSQFGIREASGDDR